MAERVARERGARIVRPASRSRAGRLRSRGAFQRRNFALARAAAEAYLRAPAARSSEQALRDAAAAAEVPGRLQVLAGEPPTVLDGAHNPDAVAALVRVAARSVRRAPPALVLGVLEDKDAAGMLARCCPTARARGSPRRRARARCRRRRCSRRRASSASRTRSASRGRARARARRASGRGSTARACSRPARSTWSASCSPAPRAPAQLAEGCANGERRGALRCSR